MLREETHGFLSNAYMMMDRLYVIIGTAYVLTQEPLLLTPRGVTTSSQIHPKRHGRTGGRTICRWILIRNRAVHCLEGRRISKAKMGRSPKMSKFTFVEFQDSHQGF